MIRDPIICAVYGSEIAAHWQLFMHATCHSSSPLSRQARWQLEKANDRLQRTLEKVKSGRPVPRFGRERQLWRHVERAKALIKL